MKIQTAREARATTKLASLKLSRPEIQFDKLRALEKRLRAGRLSCSRVVTAGTGRTL